MKFFTLFFLSSLVSYGTLSHAAGGGTGDVGSGGLDWIGYNSQCPDLSGEYRVLRSDGLLEEKTLKISRKEAEGTLLFIIDQKVSWFIDGEFRDDPKNQTKTPQWASFQCADGILYKVRNISYKGFDAESYEKRSDGLVLYKSDSFDQSHRFDQILIPVRK